ncbi:MAG TPA: glycosyltransferase, partial [Thermoanaerobaculia bacterium]|nr:glycosyltransferase [Thermoanaerobaculia bacterium]
GEGPLAAAHDALATELGIRDRVRFLGSRADVGACLEMARVFVFPSLFEGWGAAPIEAMFKGLPCIATRIEPLTELFADGETARLVTPGSRAELAAAMLELHRDPDLRRRLGASAREAAVERFDLGQGMKVWSQFYRELAEMRQLSANSATSP